MSQGAQANAAAPTGRREGLSYVSLAAIKQDIERLRRGHTQAGNWTLAQICWHLNLPLEHCLHVPASKEPTEAQRQMQQRLQGIMTANHMEPNQPMPPGTEPPADVGASAIDAFLAGLIKLENYTASHVDFGPFGPVTTGEFHAFTRIHAANHLSVLHPSDGGRVGLRYANEDELIADIRHLRKGYRQTGKWTLGQIAWHLDATIKLRMRPSPFPPDTDEMLARRPTLQKVLETGRLPLGLVAPDAIQPPADAGEEAIDSALRTIEQFKRFPGPIAPHRLFGTMDDATARQQNLVHCAHHLSYLIPTAARS
jgi:hypothetical protein